MDQRERHFFVSNTLTASLPSSPDASCGRCGRRLDDPVHATSTETHNDMISAVVTSERSAEALRDLFGRKGDMESVLRDVSREFSGAHVNADVVLAAVRRRLAEREAE